MKRLLGILALIFVFASSAYATDVTVGASTIPNFNPSNAGSDRTLTVTVNNGSNIVSCSACMPSNTVGLSGFRVNINGTQYVVQSVSTQSLFVLTTLYSGAGGSTSMTLYKYVLFRIYADRAFQPKNKTYIVQPGVPGSSSWYKQVGASIISDGATSSLYLSEMILDATTDAVSPTNQAKYTAAFYRTDNSLVQYYNCFEQFALPATTPTTWTAICTYNSPTAIVPPNRDSYTKSEIDNRFASCSSGQLYYFASSGNVVSCLTLGTNLSITSGVLNATGGGGGSSNVRQALNLVVDYSCDNTGVVAADTCLANAIAAAVATTGKIIYAPAGVYKLTTTATIPGGVTIEGDGRDKTIFSGTVASAPIFDLVQGSGAYLFKGPTIRHLQITGSGASGQIGIRATDATYVYGVDIEHVNITGTGSHGLYIGKAFSSRFVNINSGSSTTGYPFYIYADEMPGNRYESLYAGDVNAISPAGFRIQRGRVHCVSCNGINNSSSNSWWAIIGDKLGVDGSVGARSAYFQCTSCNVESSRAGGILSYSNSPIDLFGQTTFSGDGGSSGSYKAISYDIDLTLNPYPAFTGTGTISPTVSFQNSPASYYANSEPVHSTDIPPLIVEGNGPQIAGAGGFGATFYNSTTARVEKLRRADASAPFTTITTTTAFTQPGPRYFETNCASNCTLTLPWSGWYPNGEYVTVRNLSADGIVVTLASGGGGSVNGGTLAISKQGQGYTLYANNAASDWRIVADRSYLPNTYVAVGDTNMSVDGSSGLTWDTTTLTLTKAGSNPSVQVVDSTNSITTRFGPLAGAPDRGIVGTSTNHPFVFYQNGSEAWGIDTSKHLRPYATANTLDLGTSTVPARTGYFGTSLDVGVSSTTTGSITFRNSTNANTFTFQAGVTGANLTYTLPTAYSSGTQCLADNGTGTLSWTACSGGSSSPGGSNTQVQFNDSSSFNGDSGLTYNKTTNVLSVDHAIITQSDTTIVPLIVKAVGASTAELLQIKDSAGNVRAGYATSGAGFYRGFSSAPTAALANDGKLFYDITGGVTNQQLVLSKNTGQYNPIVVANQASYTANKIPLWSSTSWELENSMMTQGSGAVSLTIAPTASSSGSPTIFTLTGPAHTALAADTEATDVNLNLNRNVQFTAAGGTFSLQRAIRFQSPTYRATGSETISNATLLYLDTPKAGTNMTLTNSYALGISPSAVGHHGLYFDFQTSATGNFIEFNSSGSSFGKIVSRTDRANYVFGGHTTSTADTDGFVYIPSVAGVPAGTPTAYTGTAPLTLDSTNNRLYGYLGGAWRNLTGSGGGTPGGSDTQVQFNDSSAFGGDADFTWNKTTNLLTLTSGGIVLATGGALKTSTTGADTLLIQAYNTGGASYTTFLTLTAGASPTMSVDQSLSWADGVKQTFNPNGTNAGINVGSQAGDPSAPANGDVWYDSSGHLYRVRINGSTATLATIATSQIFTNKTLSTGISVSQPLTWSAGVRQTFSPDATTPGINVGSFAGDPSTPSNGDIWYNSTSNKFRCYENGASANCIGSGSATPAGSNKQLQFNNSSAFGGAAGFEYQSGASPNVSITAQNLAYVALKVDTAASPTASAQEWYVNGSLKSAIGPDGYLYVGKGYQSATATSGTISGTEGVGTNKVGGYLRLQGAAGTGTGAGGSITFYTAAAGLTGSSLNPYVLMGEIDQLGNVFLGDSTALRGTSATNGFLYMNATNGTPAGTPATVLTGIVPTSIDATNYRLYAYIGGAWRNLTGAAAGITIGTTTITSGTNTKVLYNNSGVVGEYTVTGSGNVVMSTNPTLTDFTLSGNISAAAWTTSGVRIKGVASTLTDTTSSGTVAVAVTDTLGGNTIAASNPTTFTDYYTTRINPPVAGSNVTFTRSWALGLTGNLQVAPTARTGSPAPAFQIITPADTGLTVNTENVFAQFGGNSSGATVTRTWAVGTTAVQRENLFIAPTYAGSGVNANFTTGATLAVSGGPIVGTNAQITRSLGALIYGEVFVAKTAGMGVRIGNMDGTSYSGMIYDDSTSWQSTITTANTAAVVFNSTGTILYIEAPKVVFNVAANANSATIRTTGTYIGTDASPSAQLHVGSQSSSRVALRADSAATPSVDIVQFTNNGTNYWQLGSAGAVTMTSQTANTATVATAKTINVNSTGTAAAGFGGQVLYQLETTTTDSQSAAALGWLWTTATHASRTSAITLSTVDNAASLAERWRLSTNGAGTGVSTTTTGFFGGTNVTGMLSESITLNTGGTTTDSTIDLPANSIILSVTGRITTTITTATDWKLGDATIADRFSDSNATLTSGTTTVGINQWKADRTTAGQGAFQQSTAKVRITTTGTPGAGVIRITIHYISLTAPTS